MREAGSIADLPFFKYTVMGKIDPKFTEALVAWMKKDHSSDDVIREGAMLLLQLNRNRILYQQILRTPQRMTKKLEYEIQKFINMRLDGYTLQDVQKLENEVVPFVEKAVLQESQAEPEADILPAESAGEIRLSGKRPDHDSLPDDIKAIWIENAERWKKMKATHEYLKTIDAPCDRYEYAKLLAELWKKYKADMCRYDDFKAGESTEDSNGKKQLTDVEKSTIDNAQSYISRFLPVLLELVAAAKEPDFADQAKLEDLRMRLQNRVNTLLQFDVEISEQRKADLISADIKLEKEIQNEEKSDSPENSEGTKPEEKENEPSGKGEPSPEEKVNEKSGDAEGDRPE